MRNGIGNVPAPSLDADIAQTDLSGGEAQTGLLVRLQHQNSALEKLRRALDVDDDDVSYAASRAS